jgi:hypothetical protein
VTEQARIELFFNMTTPTGDHVLIVMHTTLHRLTLPTGPLCKLRLLRLAPSITQRSLWHRTAPNDSSTVAHARQPPLGIPILAASWRYCAVASADDLAQRIVSATMRKRRLQVCSNPFG